jgi:hypothetical protein
MPKGPANCDNFGLVRRGPYIYWNFVKTSYYQTSSQAVLQYVPQD